jgi:hypothetical protein
MERLRQEVLDKVGPTRRPTFDDIRDMKYLRAVINGKHSQSLLFLSFIVLFRRNPSSLPDSSFQCPVSTPYNNDVLYILIFPARLFTRLHGPTQTPTTNLFIFLLEPSAFSRFMNNSRGVLTARNTRTAYSVFMMHRRKDLWGPDGKQHSPSSSQHNR